MGKRKVFLPLVLGIAVAIGIFIGSFLNYTTSSPLFTKNKQEAKIKRLINYIQYDYVDEVNTDSLLDKAITEILVKLDPHSVYIPKTEMQAEQERMSGKFVGIGVSFLMHKDSVAVTGIIEGGPSEKIGLEAGDRIIAANGDSLFGSYLEEKANSLDSKNRRRKNQLINTAVMAALKGEPGTDVEVAVYRRSTDEILKYNITRGEVPIKSVVASYMLNNDLGYIKIDRFAKTTYTEFREALLQLIDKGMTSLALDLRGNPGGFMNVANAIIDEFLEDGKLIVFTKNKSGKVTKDFATSMGSFENGDVFVLIDQNSASASEIVAGALQDNDKGTIVGRRSFGKGLVQQEMDLGDGSAIRLTVSRYYTPTGRSIQKPYDSKNYDNAYLERIHNGELAFKDSIKVVDSLKYKTPKGKIVYGGGGIVPDVFVAIDTTSTYRDYYYLYPALNNYIFKYIDNHRKEMEQWEVDDFVENFDNDNTLFENYLSEQDMRKPLTQEAKDELQMYFKAIFARDLFGQTGYFKVRHQKDKVIQKVIELNNSKN